MKTTINILISALLLYGCGQKSENGSDTTASENKPKIED